MKRLLFGIALAASAFSVVLLPASVGADISPTQTTQVILSCADGHSVILLADPATLTSLTADVQALNASGAGCTLNTTTADPSSTSPKWAVYDYNPSGQAIAPRNSPGSMPATTTGSTTTFNFIDGHYTALLTTTDKSMTGDLSTTTLTDSIDLSGSPGTTFETQRQCTSNTPAVVRFFFVSPQASGSTVGTPPAGFYTQFWWSNPVSVSFLADGDFGSMTAQMSNTALWSDWNGQPAANPAVTPAFETAIRHVQEIGLSFGGTCFFETGVTAHYPAGTPPPPYEMFSSMFSES